MRDWRRIATYLNLKKHFSTKTPCSLSNTACAKTRAIFPLTRESALYPHGTILSFVPRYRIVVKDTDGVELSFIIDLKLKSRNPTDRLREVKENLGRYGWYTRLKSMALVRIEQL